MKALYVVLMVLIPPVIARPVAREKKKIGPSSLATWRMHYADNFADYIYRFRKDGTYELVFVHKGGENPEATAREGHFRFSRTSTRGAKLKIDDEAWSLTFDRATRAKGKVSDDTRTYILFFEDPTGL